MTFPSPPAKLRYLLLQIRNGSDPMKPQEVEAFADALGCAKDRISPFDLLVEAPTKVQLALHDVVLLGGSGHYSATAQDDWLYRTLDGLRLIHDVGKPTFASCWGFQAMARAMGGSVIHDLSQAEIGSVQLRLTPAGQDDPVFGPLGERFLGLAGHEDRVNQLPEDAILLASTDRCTNQAYKFRNKPIYATQFHPELNRARILQRLAAYPEYVEKIARVPFDEFVMECEDTPETQLLLPRFVQTVFA